ncbi:MAG TPA: phosphotransferase family protein [Rhizomicrobium sp.]|jgi:aminoglycoside phosphotransferase (APT) family kinase protein|nr:phosphotransferase family protein [Rhizomicrobium sp.]
MSDALIAPLAQYLKGVLGKPDLEVANIARIPGGASRETYRFRARYSDGGTSVDRGLILRRDPPSSLIQTERSAEYRAYEAFHKLGVAVPKPVVLELDASHLERPFFIMEEIEGCSTGSIMAPDPYGPHREKIGRQFFENMGKIAGADVKAIGLDDFEGSSDPATMWKHEVERWEKEIDEDEREPQPIARAAIRWMKKNPPPPAQKLALVHGDYRSGNFVFDPNGNIRGILDWEMAHLGDPLEDLGWAIDPLWSNGDEAHPGGTIARAEALAIWEKASGLKIDPKALFWWEIFGSFKGLAIWISAGREYVDGRNPDPINAFSAWYPYTFHNRLLAKRLAEVL